MVMKHSYIYYNMQTTWDIIVSQHIERDQLSQKIKVDFLLIPKQLFFHLNFGAKIVEIGHCVLDGNFIEDVISLMKC